MNAVEVQMVARLLQIMRTCREEKVKFRECLLAATARFQKENRERALAQALEE